MADHFYGVDRGFSPLTPSNIQKGTSTTSADLELRIGDGFAWTRHEVIVALNGLIALFDQPGSAPDGTNFPPL